MDCMIVLQSRHQCVAPQRPVQSSPIVCIEPIAILSTRFRWLWSPYSLRPALPGIGFYTSTYSHAASAQLVEPFFSHLSCVYIQAMFVHLFFPPCIFLMSANKWLPLSIDSTSNDVIRAALCLRWVPCPKTPTLRSLILFGHLSEFVFSRRRCWLRSQSAVNGTY